MENVTKERQALASRLIYLLRYRHALMLYDFCRDACDGHTEHLYEHLQKTAKIVQRNRSLFKLIHKVWVADVRLKRQTLTEGEYEAKLRKAYFQAFVECEKALGREITDEELWWWVFVAGDLGISDIWIDVFKQTIGHTRQDYESYVGNFKRLAESNFFSALCVGEFRRLKEDNKIPDEMSLEEFAASTFAALLLSPPKLPKLPPNHNLLLALGISNEGEWQAPEQAFRMAEMAANGELGKATKALLKTLQRAYERQGVSSKLEYTNNAEYANNAGVLNMANSQGELTEQLSQEEVIELLKRRGINKSDLTESMWRTIFQLNDAFDEGAERGSKRGISLNAYFGEESDAIRQGLSRVRNRIKKLKEEKPLLFYCLSNCLL